MAKVNTIYGEMEIDDLERKDGVVDTDHEHTTWVEYHLKGELVHRSVHVTLKEGLEVAGIAELG